MEKQLSHVFYTFIFNSNLLFATFNYLYGYFLCSVSPFTVPVHVLLLYVSVN